MVLRPGLPVEAAVFPGDEAITTWHFAAYSPDDTVIGVASYFLESYPDLPAKLPYRLRGMATHPTLQRRAGIGTTLLRKSLGLLRRQGADLVWCYARVSAVPFYAKNGFLRLERAGVIEIQGIGPHEVWYIPLR